MDIPSPSPPPEEPVFVRLRRFLTPILHAIWSWLRSASNWIHQHTLGHPLAGIIANRLVGGALIGLGLAMAKWDEYGAALAFFGFGSIVLFLKAYHWQGFQGYRRLSDGLRALFILLTFLMIIAAYPITNAKRGQKPWSDSWCRVTCLAPFSWRFVPTPEN